MSVEHRPPRGAPLCALVVASAGWGLSTTGTKDALGRFAPVTLLLVELAAATAALWIVLLVRGYRRPGSGGRTRCTRTGEVAWGPVPVVGGACG